MLMNDWPVLDERAAGHARFDVLRELTRRADAGDEAPIIVEGAEAVRWLLTSSLSVELVIGKPSVLRALEAELGARRDLRCYQADQPAMQQLLGFAFTRGVIAVGRRPSPLPLSDLASHARRLVLTDAVHDPSNIGAIIRSARCLGLDGLVCGPGCADPWYRRSVRVSVGHVCHLPHAQVADLAAAVGALRAQGWSVYAAHRGPASVPIAAIEAQEPWAVVLGNEDRGVSGEVVAACNAAFTIPVADGVDSLNVAVAAGVAFYALASR